MNIWELNNCFWGQSKKTVFEIKNIEFIIFDYRFNVFIFYTQYGFGLNSSEKKSIITPIANKPPVHK